MKSVAAHLVLAAAAMSAWAWAVATAHADAIHLALLAVVALCCPLGSRSPASQGKRRELVTKTWTWVCLTVAAVLALLIDGHRRMVEGAQLDPDNA